MAYLYLDRDFLPDFSELEKSVRNQVLAAIDKFSEHTFAGLHLEKIQGAKDDRIRTIRINDFWRGVVVAPESGDVYNLMAVLPHDKAIAYARSRKASVNQAIGVYEVRDQQAIEQIQRGLQSAADDTGERLFDYFSDADLRGLGIDAAVLPVVRLLVTTEHLQALEKILPEVQYTALLALASGMTIQEAWEEICKYLPAEAELPPEDESVDLRTALDRTPGRVAPIAGSEELRWILDHPFAAWRTFLHPSQHAIAYHVSYNGPAQVTGGAGTGKTVTALHRAAFLARQARAGETGDQPPILLTTFTTSLAEALETQLSLLVSDGNVRSQIEILNVDKLAYRIMLQARGAPKIADGDVVMGRLSAAATQLHADLPAVFLMNEWEHVILAQDLHSEEEYLACARTGRGRQLTRSQRAKVWQAIERVTAELSAARQSTYLLLASESARMVGASGTPLYRYVIVDEGQDLHPAQWRLLRAVVAPGANDIFIAADPHQRIYDRKVSLASVGIDIRGRTRKLSVNYRTTAEILAWVVPLLGRIPVVGLDDQVASLLGYRSPMHGVRPEVQTAVSREEELDALVARVRTWIDAGIEPHAIGVAARSNRLASQARDALKSARIKTFALTTRNPESAVRVGSMHSMKGLEFQAVAVIGAEQGAIPAMTTVTTLGEDPVAHEQDLMRERCLLFVACTRARDHLYVSFTGQPSPFLPSGNDPGPRPTVL